MPAESIQLIEIAIEAKRPEDRERLLVALAEMTAGSSPVSFHTDVESGQLILNGVSELSLDRFVDEIIKTRGIPVDIGQPRVGYRETITRDATVEYTHRKMSGPDRQFARVAVAVRPGVPGLSSRIVGSPMQNALLSEHTAAIERGLWAVLKAGPLIGFPVIGADIRIVDTTQHEIYSSPVAFEIAARTALRDALTKAGQELLEPVMMVEIMAPSETVPAITRDLKTRRAVFLPGDASGPRHGITAHVPLGNMFGYHGSLGAISGGQATWTMAFSHYAQVPPNNRGPDTFGPAVGMRG